MTMASFSGRRLATSNAVRAAFVRGGAPSGSISSLSMRSLRTMTPG
ncbi:hypothetical protein GR927_01475 [Mycolicibacterium sp. 3033]|nr:hypothetical protein [Mycolicibacterium aurantiacum]